MNNPKHNKEEKDILTSVEREEWKSVSKLKREKTRHEKVARTTLKEHRINIRLPLSDLTAIKQEAIKGGIPYQTLIKSIIRKFLNGTLIRK